MLVTFKGSTLIYILFRKNNEKKKREGAAGNSTHNLQDTHLRIFFIYGSRLGYMVRLISIFSHTES